MSDFHLIFCDPQDHNDIVEIPFSLTGTNASQCWFEHFYAAIYKDGLIAKNNRWIGWPDGDTTETICDRINHNIAICRKSHPKEFDRDCSPNMTQEDFNILHTYFEIYRGELDNPHQFYIDGTEEFRESIEQLNIDIHLFEHLGSIDRKADFNFAYSGRTKLTEDDNMLFEVDKNANTLYLEYDMSGKNLMVIIMDEDEHIGDANIRRYQWIGCDFRLSIRQWTAEQKATRLAKIKDFWHRKGNWLNSLGYYEGNPNNTLGWLPLAHADIDNIESFIAPRQFLKGAKFW